MNKATKLGIFLLYCISLLMILIIAPMAMAWCIWDVWQLEVLLVSKLLLLFFPVLYVITILIFGGMAWEEYKNSKQS